MIYSQKYTLVHFFSPVQQGETFDMHEWPLHITLADVFAVTDVSSLIAEINEYASTHHPAETTIVSEGTLGTAHVWVLENTENLYGFHSSLVAILHKHGVVFNNPEFTGGGFVPHITKNGSMDVQIGDRVIINTVSLVDMFPEQNWQMRKVIKHFKQNHTRL